MSNILLAWGNRVDDATLTAGTYDTDYPRDNLKDYRLSKVARTSNDTSSNTKVRFALAAPAHIGIVALAANNLSTGATYRLQLYSDSGFSTSIYDSGTVSLYPAGTIPYGQIPWGMSNWWTALPLTEEIERFQRNLWHVLSDAMVAQYGELQITDESNPDGYVQAGRLFVGHTFQPTRNVGYGNLTHQLRARTGVTAARDGTPYFDQRRANVALPFALKHLDEDEAMRLLDLQAHADVHGECMVIFDPDEVAYAFRRQVFGRLAQLDPIEYPIFATHAAAFTVQGVI